MVMRAALEKVATRTFGEVMREEREKQGLSHTDIAATCECRRDNVKAWENNESFPTTRQLKKLFARMGRLRHYVHLLPSEELRRELEVEAVFDGDPLPRQLAAVVEAPPPPPQSFGQALKKERLHSGLSQSELGELIDVHGTTISQWESDNTYPVQSLYNKVVALYPSLSSFPPGMARPKPPGFTGSLREQYEASKADTPPPAPTPIIESVSNPPPSEPAPMSTTNVTTNPDPSSKMRLIRFGGVAYSVRERLGAVDKDATLIKDVISLLRAARNAGLEIEDIIGALE